MSNVVEALCNELMLLISDVNANHVVQKCIVHFHHESMEPLYLRLSENCVAASTNRHGCCVVQRCLDYVRDPIRKTMLDQITNSCFTLIQHPYGNYVLQYVLDSAEFNSVIKIIATAKTQLIALSRQKFSSNVIEKCIRRSDADTANKLISQIMTHQNLVLLATDPYGNYVIQTALEMSPPARRALYVTQLTPLLHAVPHNPHCRRILNKIAGLQAVTNAF